MDNGRVVAGTFDGYGDFYTCYQDWEIPSDEKLYSIFTKLFVENTEGEYEIKE